MGPVLNLLLVMSIECVKEVQVGMQIHIFRVVERCLAKDLESETDTSSQSNLWF